MGHQGWHWKKEKVGEMQYFWLLFPYCRSGLENGRLMSFSVLNDLH